MTNEQFVKAEEIHKQIKVIEWELDNWKFNEPQLHVDHSPSTSATLRKTFIQLYSEMRKESVDLLTKKKEGLIKEFEAL